MLAEDMKDKMSGESDKVRKGGLTAEDELTYSLP